MRRLPGTGGRIEVHRERSVVVRLRIIVGEVIDHLLNPYRVFRWKFAALDETPNVRVGRSIDVDGKGRERISQRGEEAILREVTISCGIEIRLTGYFLTGQWRSWLFQLCFRRNVGIRRHISLPWRRCLMQTSKLVCSYRDRADEREQRDRCGQSQPTRNAPRLILLKHGHDVCVRDRMRFALRLVFCLEGAGKLSYLPNELLRLR